MATWTRISALLVLCAAAACAQVQYAPGGETQVEGVMEIAVQDFDDHTHRYIHTLVTRNERVELRLSARDARRFRNGDRVRARGMRSNGSFLVSDGELQPLAFAAATARRLGELRTLVLLLKFEDVTTEFTTIATATSVMTRASDFFRENSQGQAWLAFEIGGWFTLPMTGACDTNQIATLANAAAKNAAYDLTQYDRFVYAFPRVCSGWSGMGLVGGQPSRTWINGQMQFSVMAHELGHNFGLYHSHALKCSGKTIGTVGADCTSSEYGDMFDMMGNYSTMHFNAYQKENIGWLNAAASLPIISVGSSGTYRISPYSTPASSAKALKVLKSTDPATGAKTYYYVEYRYPSGFDEPYSGIAAATNAVLVHTGSNGDLESSFLLDMNPGTPVFADAALVVGKDYKDDAAGVTIRLMSADANEATVKVDLGAATCVRNQPTITLSPADQTVTRGASATYTLMLKNNDSSACSATTFDLSRTAPAGWAAILGQAILTLAPGATATTTLKVTAPAS